MKLLKVFTIMLIALAFMSVTAFGQNITGSDHDFSGKSWSNGKVCVVCHTPHNADQNVSGAPLWNHAVTTATFQLYSSATLDATIGNPDGVSKLCLSCHDGTVGIDNYGGRGTSAEIISGGALIGTDLTNDHPVSFTYDANLAATDGGLFDPTTTNSGLGGKISDDMLFGQNNDRLECASCHNPHDRSKGKFLRKDNTGSGLCFTCHNK